ncbi:hypothetical protein X975_02424, partial [Stegodyphus mimosarum]
MLSTTHRTAETPLQTQIRLGEQVERQAAFRAAETPLQTQIRLKEQDERQTTLRAIETPLQIQIRLEEQAQQQAVIRARDTLEQLQARRIVHAEMQTERWGDFMHNNWSVFHDSGLQYDPSIDYHTYPLIVIGEQEEPLKTLYLYDTNESKRFLSKIRKYNSCFEMTSFGVEKAIRMPVFLATYTVQGQICH